MTPSIKGLVLQQGDTVKFAGQLHYVKSFQLVTGSQPILTLAPISEELVQVSFDELDSDDHGNNQSGDQE